MNLDELKKEAERLGYELVKNTDEIFLLSVEEYEKYKHIPQVRTWWWLRSRGCICFDSNFAAIVGSDGAVNIDGNIIDNNYGAVRPALRIPHLKVGERVIKYDFPWIGIGGGLAIAEVPIAFRRFDEKSNEYEISEIREFLRDWVMAKSENYD